MPPKNEPLYAVLLYQFPVEKTDILNRYLEKLNAKPSSIGKDMQGTRVFFSSYTKSREILEKHYFEVENQLYPIYPSVTNLTVHGIRPWMSISEVRTHFADKTKECLKFFNDARVLNIYVIKTKLDDGAEIKSNDYRVILFIPEISKMISNVLEPIVISQFEFKVTYFCRLCRKESHTQFDCVSDSVKKNKAKNKFMKPYNSDIVKNPLDVPSRIFPFHDTFEDDSDCEILYESQNQTSFHTQHDENLKFKEDQDTGTHFPVVKSKQNIAASTLSPDNQTHDYLFERVENEKQRTVHQESKTSNAEKCSSSFDESSCSFSPYNTFENCNLMVGKDTNCKVIHVSQNPPTFDGNTDKNALHERKKGNQDYCPAVKSKQLAAISTLNSQPCEITQTLVKNDTKDLNEFKNKKPSKTANRKQNIAKDGNFKEISKTPFKFRLSSGLKSAMNQVEGVLSAWEMERFLKEVYKQKHCARIAFTYDEDLEGICVQLCSMRKNILKHSIRNSQEERCVNILDKLIEDLKKHATCKTCLKETNLC